MPASPSDAIFQINENNKKHRERLEAQFYFRNFTSRKEPTATPLDSTGTAPTFLLLECLKCFFFLHIKYSYFSRHNWTHYVWMNRLYGSFALNVFFIAGHLFLSYSSPFMKFNKNTFIYFIYSLIYLFIYFTNIISRTSSSKTSGFLTQLFTQH